MVNGVVDLWGTISNDQERRAICVIAENTPGVKKVIDHLVFVEAYTGTVIERRRRPASDPQTHRCAVTVRPQCHSPSRPCPLAGDISLLWVRPRHCKPVPRFRMSTQYLATQTRCSATIALQQALAGGPLVFGNQTRLLKDGGQAFPAMFEAMQQARDHINLEYFIFEDVVLSARSTCPTC